MKKTEWIYCPVCGSKTRDRIREDTFLKNYPLYCPKCKHETLIEAKKLWDKRGWQKGMGMPAGTALETLSVCHLK